MIIGITGLIGSGKGAVAQYVVSKGFLLLGHSAIISEEVRKRGLPITRDNQVLVANEVRRTEGADAWAKKLIAQIEPHKNYVVEGFRNVAEVQAFRKLADFTLIGVAAGSKRRFAWLCARKRLGDPLTWDAFRHVEQRDFLQADPAGQQNALCFSLADYYITNEGTLEELYAKVDVFLMNIKIK